MKKNYFSLFAAATMMLAVTSCSQEEDFAPVQSGDVVSFKVNLEGAAGSRAAGDGMTAKNLYFEVYQGDTKVVDNYGEGLTDHYKTPVELKEGKAEIKLPLLRGEKYKIMFWAQAVEGSIYDPTNLKEIGVNYEGAIANNEANDAFFFGDDDFQASSNVTEITLRRPFAQLNVGTTVDDWNTAISMIDESNLPVTTSEVTVTGLANQFNVLAGEATGSVDVTFQQTALLDETFKATVNEVETEYRYLAMNYLLVPGKAASTSTDEVKGNTNVTATFWRGDQLLFTIEKTNLANVPIQRNWRTNILGNLLADNKTFEIVVDAIFENDNNIFLDDANTSEELEKLLKQDLEHIVIDLAKVEGRAATANEYVVDVAAWEENAWGSEKTKTITINANYNTINFNLTNSDWSHVILKNPDAKLIINNATLKSSGKNTGHWKRLSTHFACNVEFNNVTTDNMGIGLKKDALLNNVTVVPADKVDAYSLWIWANGQKVDVENLIVNASSEGNRGIKIADEDVEEVKTVTLNVKNSKFTTNKKAAILVTSTAGADITLENLDISNVEEDKLNAVWVDEDRADNYDLVTVAGGFKKLEGSEENIFANNATIELPAGTYTLPSMASYEGITIIGTEGTVIGGDNATTGFGSNFGKNTTIKNVTFSGKTNGVRYSYAKGGKTEFEDCTFEGGSIYGFHIDQSNGAEFVFTNCTFSGFNAFAGDLVSVTFNNCTFKSNGNYGHTNIWSKGYFNNCTWEDATSVSGAGDNSNLYFNNEEESYHHEFIGSAENLFAFAETVNRTEKPDSWKGQAVILVNDIDLENQAWTPVGACNGGAYFQGTFDGNGKTIYNLNVDNSTDTDANATSGLFGWIDQAGATIKNVKVENAAVKGSHWTGVIAGYATGRIENCTVTNATVVGYNVNDDANGDKIGGIVGHLNEHSYLNGNTVSNSTISGNRDLGGIAGAVAASTYEMKNNKVSDVVITYSTPKDYASAGIFVSGRTGYVVDESNTSSNVTINCVVTNAEGLKAALADNTIGTIYLGEGSFGTIVAKSNKTIIGSENAKVDAVNLNGAANLTLKKITFDAAKAIQGYNGKDKVVTYAKANIVTGDANNNPKVGARNLVIDECTFGGKFESGYAAIAFADQSRGSGQSGDITIKNCTFETEGGNYHIYGYYTGKDNFIIENNKFLTSVKSCQIGLGNYQSSTAVVVKNNVFKTETSFEKAAYIQPHSASYNVSFSESGNTFKAE